jgi:DNA polymerase I-like protein with 3'-5' exonuclease and polymerase domains
MAEPSYDLITNARALDAVLDDVASHAIVGLDTETTGLDPFTSRVRLLQLSTPSRTYVVDCFAFEALGNAKLRALLEAPRPIKVLHNAKFDARMLERHGDVRLNGVFDTYLASQVVSAGASGTSHSLKAVAERYLEVQLDKSAQLSDWSGDLSEEQIAYAAEDARLVLPLREKLVEQIKKLGLVEVAKIEFDCATAVARMENAGIYVDRARWEALCDVVDQAHKLLRAELVALFAPAMPQMTLFGEVEINLDSPSQIQEALNRLGIPVEGTRAFQLQQFARSHEVVAKLLEYRGVAKQMTSYGRAMLEHIHPVTGRIHPSFIQIGAPSGRFACMDPSVQQIPNSPEYRECVRGPEGRRLVIADYSQVELRILADWSQDTALLKAFQSGQDLHRVTASQMFNVPFEEVSKKQRSAAKSLNFGLLYGMGAQGLANRIETTPLEAEQLIRKYFAAYRGVERWLRDAGERAVRERHARTRANRLVRFEFDEKDRSQVAGIVRLGKNVPIQGCLGPDSCVHTDQGIWRIADLAARDCSDLKVFDGEAYVPFRAFRSGPKRAFRVTTEDGWSIVASADHRFWVATPKREVWKPVSMLRTGDVVSGTWEPAPPSVPSVVAPGTDGGGRARLGATAPGTDGKRRHRRTIQDRAGAIPLRIRDLCRRQWNGMRDVRHRGLRRQPSLRRRRLRDAQQLC